MEEGVQDIGGYGGSDDATVAGAGWNCALTVVLYLICRIYIRSYRS